MKVSAELTAVEPRWPVGLTTLVVLFLLVALPGRIRLLPVWVLYIVGFAVLAPMVAVGLGPAKTLWRRIERVVTLLFVATAGAATLGTLAYLIAAMVRGYVGVEGLQLLTSSVGVWITNVLIFSLLYWQTDRGGPNTRSSGVIPKPDVYFSQESVPAEVLRPGWRPAFIDYLFLAFSTATAFSATDAMPLTPRAKIMMMLESLISLITIVVVAARAINIIGP